jgi:hypothetical protein
LAERVSITVMEVPDVVHALAEQHEQLSGLLHRIDELRAVAGPADTTLLDTCADRLRSGDDRLQQLAAHLDWPA